MKTNKQIKRMIASVTGGKWIATEEIPRPALMVSVSAGFAVWRAFFVFHKTVSIKASEVN